jgi:2-oxoglutarate dehydrogenase E2 component (dihydrolipoamide succinyltransferase)
MDVLMPQFGETVEEGTVAAWHKQEGDTVEVDEILCDIETDKVSMEIPAPKAGTLAKILVADGETVPVGTMLAVILAEGETLDEAIGAGAATKAADPASPSPSPSPSPEPAPAAPAAAPVATPPPAAPASTANATATATTVGDLQAVARSAGQKLSPAVRRLVSEHNLDLSAIEGTGRNGRVTRRNVIEFIESGGAATAAAAPQAPAAPPAAAPAAAPAARSAPAAAKPASGLVTGRVPFNRVRKLTADHMVKSKATSPHVLQAVEVDFSGVDRVRKAVRESWKAQRGYSLTYLPFIAHAVCTALREFPHANASIGDNELILHGEVNLAIAIDLGPDGLVAPVIRGADRMSLTQLAESINDLASRARSNRLKPDDLSGGTYTLSNSGTFGTLITAPIINQPQVAILSTDGVRKRPVVIEHPDGDSIAIRPVGILAQSFDHRAFDGAYSAAFLDRLRKILERNDWFREL